MRKLLSSTLAAASVAAMLGATVPAAFAYPPLPPPRFEPRPPIPHPGWHWRPGYWNWYHGNYVWVGGAWGAPGPEYGYGPHGHWVPGHWGRYGNWVRPHWAP